MLSHHSVKENMNMKLVIHYFFSSFSSYDPSNDNNDADDSSQHSESGDNRHVFLYHSTGSIYFKCIFSLKQLAVFYDYVTTCIFCMFRKSISTGNEVAIIQPEPSPYDTNNSASINRDLVLRLAIYYIYYYV